MVEHFDALEASFQASYGIDLRRALWGPRLIGVRRIGALIGGLPPGGPLDRSLNGAAAGWGPREEFLATAAELLDVGNRLFWQANFKGKPPGEALEIKRPRSPRSRPEVPQVQITSREELRAALEREGRLFKGARKVAAKLKGGENGD